MPAEDDIYEGFSKIRCVLNHVHDEFDAVITVYGTRINETTKTVRTGGMGGVEIEVPENMVGEEQVNCSVQIGSGVMTKTKTFNIISKLDAD